MVAADDFTVPLAIQTCRALTVDLVFLRQLGRVESNNYRVPTNVTLWIFPASALVGKFNRTRALYERVYVVPSEGAWDPVGSTGGVTVDRPGTGYYYHLERMRFAVSNVTLRSNTTYWIAVLAAIDRAYNSTDFSQNLMRVAVRGISPTVVTASAFSGGEQYRVVDVYGNLYRNAPILLNWTRADAAEASILPYMTNPSVASSVTHQLAMDVYASQCTALAPVPPSIVRYAQLPPREPDLLATSASTPESSTPSFWTVASSPSSASPPSSSGPIPSPRGSSSSALLASPTVMVTATPPPSPLPFPSSSPTDGSGTPPVAVEHTNANAMRLMDWIFILIAAVSIFLFAGLILFIVLRCRLGVRFTNMSYDELQKNSSGDDDDSRNKDEAQIPLANIDDDVVDETYADAVTDKQDSLLAQAVNLNTDNKK